MNLAGIRKERKMEHSNFQQKHSRIKFIQLGIILLFVLIIAILRVIPNNSVKAIKEDYASDNFVGPLQPVTVKNMQIDNVEKDTTNGYVKIFPEESMDELTLPKLQLYSNLTAMRIVTLKQQAVSLNEQTNATNTVEKPVIDVPKVTEASEQIIVEEVKEPEVQNEESYYVEESYNYEEPCNYEPEPVYEEPQPVIEITPFDGYSNELLQNLSEEDQLSVKMIALTIDKESNGSIEDDYGVASVIMNRTRHSAFPGTTPVEVITQKWQYSWVPTKDFEPEKACEACTEESLKVAYDVFVNGNNIFPENVVFQAQFTQGNGTYAKIGVHYYCYL